MQFNTHPAMQYGSASLFSALVGWTTEALPILAVCAYIIAIISGLVGLVKAFKRKKDEE